jgi:cytochrome P450
MFLVLLVPSFARLKFRIQDRSQMPKGDGRGPEFKPYTIMSAPDDIHARQRRILSTSFSERAVSSGFRRIMDRTCN